MDILRKLFGGQKNAARNPTHADESHPPGDTEGAQQQIVALYQQAIILAQSGDTAACEQKLREAIRLCHQNGDTSYLAQIADRLAFMMVKRGDLEGALRMLSLNEEVYVRVSNQYSLAWSVHTRGLLTRNGGDKLAAMSLLQQANESCNGMVDYCKQQGNALLQTQVLKLQRNIIWDMSPEAAEAIGFDRASEYKRVLDDWVTVSKQANNPEHVAESLLLLAMSPYHGLPEGRKTEILDEAFQAAAASGRADLAESISRTKRVMSLTSG